MNILLKDSSSSFKESVKKHRIFQVLIEDSATKNGRETYTGSMKSQTNI